MKIGKKVHEKEGAIIGNRYLCNPTTNVNCEKSYCAHMDAVKGVCVMTDDREFAKRDENGDPIRFWIANDEKGVMEEIRLQEMVRNELEREQGARQSAHKEYWCSINKIGENLNVDEMAKKLEKIRQKRLKHLCQ